MKTMKSDDKITQNTVTQYYNQSRLCSTVAR